jgi:adenosylhomocysteine nucleosidase
MEEQRIVILVAMPEEARPVARRLHMARSATCAGNPAYRGSMTGSTLYLVRSGMGTAQAAAATRALLAAWSPHLVISAGFGGAVRAGLQVGDVVIADTLFTLEGTRLSPPETSDNGPLRQRLSEALADVPFRLASGSIITTSSIVAKEQAARLLPAAAQHPVLDMETSAVAAVCRSAAVPFLAVRAISDGADEELSFSLEELTDQNLDIRLGKVLHTILRKPYIIPQLLRLAGNSRRAGRNLALVMEQLVRLS